MAISTPTPPDVPSVEPAGPIVATSKLRGALAGLVAGAMAIAVGELVAGLIAPTPGLVAAVANRVIDLAPASVNELGKEIFGLNQKPALIIGTTILALVFAAVLGVASLRRPAIGIAGIAAFGLVGLLSVADDAQSGIGGALIVAVPAVLAGVAALVVLTRIANDSGANAISSGAETITAASAPAPARRSFLGWVFAGGAVALLGNFAGQTFRSRASASAARDQVDLAGIDAFSDINARVASGNATEVAATPGISPLVVPNGDYYRIDTALLVPQVNPDNWELEITGMVDNPRTYTFDELVERANTVEPVTLSCVSNEVGGGLVGNAIWQGVPLAELLDEVGVQAGATQLKSESVDGWNCGFPTDLAYDGRTALVAIAMNDVALPIEHGFPARLVVSGLYGYVSATKWLRTIELTTLEDFDGYWIPRGWSKFGPVKTQSRIDTPRRGTRLELGQDVSIAGVAWAPNLGIERVEVQVDDLPWVEAELGESLGVNAWRQWRVRWAPTSDSHVIRVRATDQTGFTQGEERQPPAPNGASGWHTISVRT